MVHFTVKKISGKNYQYIGDYLYIAKGVTKLKSKSLGRLENPLDQRIKYVESFVDELIEEEAKERLKYWSAKIENKKGFLFELEKLEKLRSKLHRSKEALPELGQAMMEAGFQIDFIYNSNKIEGSKVPRETVEEMVRRGGKSSEEVANSLRALAFIRDKGKVTSIRGLIKLHKILLAHEPSNHGLRKQPIMVFNSPTLPFNEVPSSLEKLFRWLGKSNHKMYPPELAFTFYYRFERIHPFKDGNGRTGRMLINAILKEHRYHPIIIWDSNRRAHINAFEKDMEGGAHKYMQFMVEQMEKTYEVYLAKIRRANQMEKEIQDTFFTPSE